MHTASITSQQQLAFLQDKGFWKSQQVKQKLHVTSVSRHLWLSALHPAPTSAHKPSEVLKADKIVWAMW